MKPRHSVLVRASVVFISFLFLCKNGFALQLRSATVMIPPYDTLQISLGLAVPILGQKGEFKIYFIKNSFLPIRLTVSDLFGASKTYEFSDPSQLVGFVSVPGIVQNKAANPIHLDILPKLCPRLTIESQQGAYHAAYDAAADILNHRPTLQLADHDARFSTTQREILKNFDDKNILTITRVKIRYDYEDTAIVDYDVPDPMTGKPSRVIHEGEGGFYANFHYAIVPYEERYLHLGRQELLNLAEGKLYFIDREDLTPKLRVHSFIPGPYLSKTLGYDVCEWGDTEYQAPVQELTYKDFAIWDWDMQVDGRPADKLILIVWEGDEEDWMIAKELIDPFYLTDDVVGTFVFNRGQTEKPLVLRNDKKDFEVEVVTKK